MALARIRPRLEPPPRPSWPPDYRSHFEWRQKQLAWLREDPERLYGALQYYATHPIEFIEHWGITYDPRNIGTGVPAFVPFIFFPRQREFIQFLQSCQREGENGLVEKCRDMGATWGAGGYSVWTWRFEDGSAVGWGSRLVKLVDEIGIIDSIFEKMRVFIRWLPPEFWPVGFDPEQHMPYMRILNPQTGASISGEGGDNIGRGGRKTIYFKDESAHYEHPETVEAALTSNAAVQVDISSVHGLGNVFHRRREAGVEWTPGAKIERGRTRIFVMDWRDHPAKTQEWYNRGKRQKLEEGLAHIWAQEVDRNYSAAVIGTIIPFEWVRAAIDAHIKLDFKDDGAWCGALDVADGGTDTNAFSLRRGIVLKHVEEWTAPDPAVTARRAINLCVPHCSGPLQTLELQYDSIGVGASVKSEGNRLTEERLLPRGLRLVPWNAGEGPLFPEAHVIPRDRDSPLNFDFYANLKAQGWWQLRGRFERTWRAVVYTEMRQLQALGTNTTIEQQGRLQELRQTLQGALEDDLMISEYTWDSEDLISLSSADIPVGVLRKLEKELSQPTAGQSSKLKMLINKAPDGTKSPNLADSVMMNYWPVPVKKALNVTAAILARASIPG